MKKSAVPLKVWLWVLLSFLVIQWIINLTFEEKIYHPKLHKSLSDRHFSRLETDFQNTEHATLKVAAIGSSRLAKGIECPDEVRTILSQAGQPPIQLNKIFESYDQFHFMVNRKELLKKIMLTKPDLICIQAEMLAVQMYKNPYGYQPNKKEQYLNQWDLQYTGNPKEYVLKKLKYFSKVNQTLANRMLLGHPFSKSNKPCTINDRVMKIDTINHHPRKYRIKKLEDLQYAFEDLERIKLAGIKVVIIDVPMPSKWHKKIYTSSFKEKLQPLLSAYKNRFGIEFWEYDGPPLYYTHYNDGAHLNKKGRQIYTRWLLDKILHESPKH